MIRVASVSSVFLIGLSFLSVSTVHGLPQPGPVLLEERNLLGDILNALSPGFVTQINSYLSTETFVTNKMAADFDIKNSLALELTIDRVVSQVGINGTVYATFNHTFSDPVVVKGKETVNSGRIDNVLLVKGIEASVEIVPLGYLDLINSDVYARVATVNGKLGIPLPIKGLKQQGVPAKYEFVL